MTATSTAFQRWLSSHLRKSILAAAALLASAAFVSAQETVTLDDLADSAQAWAKENLDEDLLRALEGKDQRRVKEFIDQLQKELHGEYVIDLARLKDAATSIVPLLESYEETQPYAAWLKPRLDYLEIAEELRILIPPPKPKPGEIPKPVVVPPAKAREVWIKKVTARPWPPNARPYVDQLKPIFAAEKVPPELVWVAEVESSFDPRARSPAGAVGMFQLMPATAKSCGLSTWPFDQRLKPEPSARAAAQYLKKLYSRYHDWRLALAAYNAGPGTVDGLLARQKTRSFDAIATRLPAETQLYVPKLEATLRQREVVSLTALQTPREG